MPFLSPARVVRTFLTALLILGPVLSLASPAAAGMNEGRTMAGLMAAGHGAEAGCTKCPDRSEGKRLVASGCDATCPLMAALPALAISAERSVKPSWMPLPVSWRLGMTRPVDPRPPKSSSAA